MLYEYATIWYHNVSKSLTMRFKCKTSPIFRQFWAFFINFLFGSLSGLFETKLVNMSRSSEKFLNWMPLFDLLILLYKLVHILIRFWRFSSFFVCALSVFTMENLLVHHRWFWFRFVPNWVVFGGSPLKFIENFHHVLKVFLNCFTVLQLSCFHFLLRQENGNWMFLNFYCLIAKNPCFYLNFLFWFLIRVSDLVFF